MAQFAFGFIIGMLLVTTLTHTSPRSTAIQQAVTPDNKD